jgi:hypothetical protein
LLPHHPQCRRPKYDRLGLYFVARLENDPDLADTVVVFDDLTADERPVEAWSHDDWYDAWLDYADPSEFPRETIDAHFYEF